MNKNYIFNTFIYFLFIIHSSSFLITSRPNTFRYSIVTLNNQFFDDEPWPSSNNENDPSQDIPSDTNPDYTNSLYEKPSKEPPLRDFHSNSKVKSYLSTQIKQNKNQMSYPFEDL